MEGKSTVNRDRSPPDLSILETQDLPATEKILFTQDFDDTQLVEATPDISKDVSKDGSVCQTRGEVSTETQQCNEVLNTCKDSLNPLKDLSNLPKRSNLSKTKMPSSCDNFNLECSEDVLPSQVSSSDENDVTPEISTSALSDCRSAGLKGKVESVGGVPLSQSSGSSENPESTSSGSQPSSSQLSSSDHGSCGDASHPTTGSTPKPLSVADCGMNLDVTQDLFLSQEASFGETSLSPLRTALQKESPASNTLLSPLSVMGSIPVGRDHRDEKEAHASGGLFRVPQQTKGSTKGSAAVDKIKQRQRRSSSGKLSALKEQVKSSPPLDSQEVTLRVSGSGSETNVAAHDEEDDDLDDDMDVFSALKSPDTSVKSQQVYGSAPERGAVVEKFKSRDTAVMVKRLFVFSKSLVNCKIEADRKSGEVISLEIKNVDFFSTDANELEKPRMPGTITTNTEPSLPTAALGGDFSDDSWKAAMVSCFEEALKKSLTSSFQETRNFSISADRVESLERKEPLMTPITSAVTPPVTSTVTCAVTSPVTSVRFPRKRKHSLSSTPTKRSISSDMPITKPSPSSSPFKRPKVENLRARREKTQSPRKRLISPPRPPPSLSNCNSTNVLPEGAKVFALWIDKMYYAAKVVRQSGLDHYMVKFHDGKEKELPFNKMCVVNTFEINDNVLAKVSPKGDYKIGVVQEVEAFDFAEDKYVIKLNSDGSLLELPRDDISLNENMIQAHRVRNSTLLGTADTSRKNVADTIDLGNVVHGKRTRSAASPSPLPGTSGFKSKLNASGSSSCDEVERADASLKITGVEVEENNVDPLAGKGSRKTKGRRKTGLPEEERLLNEYGPIPEEGCKLFTGLSFILTCATKHDHITKDRPPIGSPTSDHSDVDSSSENDCFCGPFSKIKTTMSKSRLTEQLIAGGGKILTTLDGLDSETQDVFLIANRPCHTAVYVHCLALGIKGVLFDAVIHCCKKGINFKEYIEKCKIFLDAGYSIKEKRLIPWNEFKDKASKPFRNTTIHVYSRDRSFIKYWEKVLTCAGATSIKLNTLEEVSFCTVIVAEPPVSAILRSSARESSTPIVSTDWIVQSLIHNEALPSDWHSDFRVHYDDSD